MAKTTARGVYLTYGLSTADGDLTKYTEWIVRPSTIGRGKQYYKEFKNHPIVEQLGYKDVDW